jgi:predicted nuclease of predicted toxin-antitoxin system
MAAVRTGDLQPREVESLIQSGFRIGVSELNEVFAESRELARSSGN